MAILRIYSQSLEAVVGEVEFGTWSVEPVLDGDGNVTKWEKVFTADENGPHVRYEDEGQILAARKRLDGQWGFEIQGAEDTRIAPQEVGVISANGQKPSDQEVITITNIVAATPTTESSYVAGGAFPISAGDIPIILDPEVGFMEMETQSEVSIF